MERILWVRIHGQKKLLWGAGFLLGSLILFVLGARLRHAVCEHQRLYGQPRKEWKELAIATLSRKIADSGWLTNEIAAAKARLMSPGLPTNKEIFTSQGWIRENLLLMQNGEWIVYTNICTKQDRRI